MSQEIDAEPELRTRGGKHDIHIKAARRDADDPEVTHTYVWWVGPVMQTGPENARLDVTRYLHKRWTTECVPTKPSEEYEGEEIIESVGWVDQDELSMVDLPDPVIERLMNWFGTTLVKRSVEHAGGTLPTNQYECSDCGVSRETTPRDTCPDCESDLFLERPESYDTPTET